MARITGSGLLVALALALGAEAAPALTGREVMDNVDKRNRAQDEVFTSKMTIISARGIQRERELITHLKAAEGDDDKTLMRFLAPADVKGAGLLIIEDGADDTQWLYLPSLRKTRRIAGSAKANAFMGSTFSNYDMRTENLAIHAYELKGEVEHDGRPCYVVFATPKDDDAAETTGYGRRELLVDKERWVVLKCSFFDRELKPLKTALASGFHQVDGLWREGAIACENVDGERTVMEHTSREVNTGIADSAFTKRELESP